MIINKGGIKVDSQVSSFEKALKDYINHDVKWLTYEKEIELHATFKFIKNLLVSGVEVEKIIQSNPSLPKHLILMLADEVKMAKNE